MLYLRFTRGYCLRLGDTRYIFGGSEDDVVSYNGDCVSNCHSVLYLRFTRGYCLCLSDTRYIFRGSEDDVVSYNGDCVNNCHSVLYLRFTRGYCLRLGDTRYIFGGSEDDVVSYNGDCVSNCHSVLYLRFTRGYCLCLSDTRYIFRGSEDDVVSYNGDCVNNCHTMWRIRNPHVTMAANTVSSCMDPGIFVRGGPCQSDTKSSDVFLFYFFLVLSLFYRSQMVNFKEIYHFSRFQRGSNIFQGGPTFSRGGGGPIAYSL